MILQGDPYPGIPFNVKIGDSKFRVGILQEGDDFLDPAYEFKVRKSLKGEDYTLEFPDKEEYKDLNPPVILTLIQVSWKEEKNQGLKKIPNFLRYKVKVNGKEIRIWYNEEKNLIYPEDFEKLKEEYPKKRIMVAVGIKKENPPKYPENESN